MVLKIFTAMVLFASVGFTNEYKTVAENFLKYKGVSDSIDETIELKSISGDIVGYVFTLEEIGYIIVPATKSISPIKSYSFDGKFENMHPDFKKYLIEELTAYKAGGTLNKIIDDTIQKRWELLENYDEGTKKIFNKANPSPLLDSTWNQPYPYNKVLPKIGNTHVLTGCVQTADGQVMRYHKWPAKGQEYAYNKQSTNSVTDLSAVFHRYYNWDIMPANLDNAKSYEIDEVAYLMKDLVVANQAMFEGTSGTGAFPNPEPLVRYFKYSKDIKVMSGPSTDFFNTIKDQYSKNLPMLFSVPGHRVVVDGYDDSLIGSYAHINMGWGGSANAYYNLESTIYAGGYTFAPNYSMFYDVKPCSDTTGDCYSNTENSNELYSDSTKQFNGVFDSQSDVDSFKVKLKGSIKISGDRTGFGTTNNMYFFVGIFDEDGKLLHNISKTTTITFSEGNYEIRGSLTSFDSGSYWPMQGGENGYNIKLEEVYNAVISDAQNITYPPVIDQTIGTQVISGEHKIVIYGYDKNDEDTLEFTALANNANLSVDMNQSVLTLTPNVDKGHAKVKVTLSSGGEIVEKEFDVIISDSDVKFGKEFTISGMFESQADYNEHTVILDGVCSITGQTLGYSNQAFFTKLEDQYGMSLSSMSTNNINTSNLTAGSYTIGASLMQNPGGYGSYYPYGDNTKNYQLFVSCPNADTSIEAISGFLEIVIDDSGYEEQIENSLPAVTITSSIVTEYNTAKTFSYGVSDADGDEVTVSIQTDATNGSTVIDSSAKTITYTPNNNYSGNDSFVVSFDDGNGKTVEKTVSVTVNEEVNVIPSVSIETSHTLLENNTTTIPYSVYDANGDSVTVTITTEPLNGTTTINTNDKLITYTPDQEYSGDDSFVVTFDDTKGGVVTKNISLVVLEAANNQPEVDINSSVSTNQNTSVQIEYTVSDQDGDTVTVSIKQAPSYGAAVVDNGFITYIPNTNYYGDDLFIVSFSDGEGAVIDKTVSVAVVPVVINSQPVIEIPSLLTTIENQSVSTLYSIYDEDEDSVSISIESNASNGMVVINELNSSLVYTPNSDFYGNDSFTLVLNDGNTDTVSKTVNIIVNKDNNTPPTVMRLVNYHTGDQDTNLTLEPKPIVFDQDGDELNVTLNSAPQNGSVSITAGTNEGEQVIVYTPNNGFYGEDSFEISFADSNGAKVIEEITVSITQGQTSYLNISQGWNLVALPVDINLTDTNLTNDFTKSSAIWKYTSNGWEAFGGTQAIKDSLSIGGITQLTSLEKGEGFWINNSLSQTIAFKGDTYSIVNENALMQASSGWSLLGTGQDVTVQEILVANPSLNSIWIYENGWKAYSPLQNMSNTLLNANIEVLEKIMQGQGFWVNNK